MQPFWAFSERHRWRRIPVGKRQTHVSEELLRLGVVMRLHDEHGTYLTQVSLIAKTASSRGGILLSPAASLVTPPAPLRDDEDRCVVPWEWIDSVMVQGYQRIMGLDEEDAAAESRQQYWSVEFRGLHPPGPTAEVSGTPAQDAQDGGLLLMMPEALSDAGAEFVRRLRSLALDGVDVDAASRRCLSSEMWVAACNAALQRPDMSARFREEIQLSGDGSPHAARDGAECSPSAPASTANEQMPTLIRELRAALVMKEATLSRLEARLSQIHVVSEVDGVVVDEGADESRPQTAGGVLRSPQTAASGPPRYPPAVAPRIHNENDALRAGEEISPIRSPGELTQHSAVSHRHVDCAGTGLLDGASLRMDDESLTNDAPVTHDDATPPPRTAVASLFRATTREADVDLRRRPQQAFLAQRRAPFHGTNHVAPMHGGGFSAGSSRVSTTVRVPPDVVGSSVLAAGGSTEGPRQRRPQTHHPRALHGTQAHPSSSDAPRHIGMGILEASPSHRSDVAHDPLWARAFDDIHDGSSEEDDVSEL